MKEKVNDLWSSGDKDVAKKLVFMYTLNSKIHGWWLAAVTYKDNKL